MHKECVFNELSLLEFDTCQHDGTTLMATLLSLRKLVGATDLPMWHTIREDPQSVLGQRFQELMNSRPRHSDELKKWNILRRLVFDRSPDFDDEFGLAVRLDKDIARELPEDIAHGLARAYRMQGLALSLATSQRWMLDRIPIEIESRFEKARHAAVETHLAAHHDWTPLSQIELLRITLATSTTTHVEASKYKKHMHGSTNADRKRNATGPGGDGQFIAERNGEPVTHVHIREWEERALNWVRNDEGGRFVVERNVDRNFHVFADLEEIVGYEAGSGEPTTWMRVEWCSGSVHSHPRNPSRTRI